ncbi:ABC transporter permease subunit [Poseidonocella sp. HB161398]|uniref:ABC transporter permease subunit n=1 Tax=Poseidonocella sp. HB161398 TaxID=2320855 RepID=UPI001486C639|nr:ABC transporter permease subunit [Poseidonocella sp. HB161398]
MLGVLAGLALAASNILRNMAAAGMAPSYGFLGQSAGFDVSEALIPYVSGDSYLRVIAVGVLNTLLLAAVSLVAATVVGVFVGLMSVSPSPVARAVARAYVEALRNFPKLLILLVLFVVAVTGLPHVREAVTLGPVVLSNRSLHLPVPVWDLRLAVLAAALGLGAVAAGLLGRRGAPRPATALAFLLPPVAAVLVPGAGPGWSVPELAGFDYAGGVRVSLQFMVIAATLALYHGAQIGEVMRGGIEAVPAGQIEAARALGLPPSDRTRFVMLPQALRIIVPPMNNQYANLVKNTSVAIAVGYSDLMSVSGTIINQTFRPMEMMLLTMAAYLLICLAMTTWLNRVNDRLRLKEGR